MKHNRNFNQKLPLTVLLAAYRDKLRRFACGLPRQPGDLW